VATVVTFSIGNWSSLARADAVTDWNAIATTAAAAPIKNGIIQTRIYAMVHAAVHDALNAIDRRYRPYALDVRVDPNASPDAAVAAAAHDVLIHELPVSQHAFLDAQYANSLSGIPDSPAKVAGIAVGQAAAATIIAVRISDGADAPMSYTPDSGPGEWIPTPPAFLPALLPGWEDVMPFTLRSSAQFRLDPPAYFNLTSEEYTADYNEVKQIGDVNSPSRTAEQSQIAQFWYEPSAQGWNRIARFVSAQRGLELWDNARLFGLVNFALADAYIAHSDTKYFYTFWRPITAIRAGDTDGNPATVADPAWTSFLVTPNFPDYPSGHSTAGGGGGDRPGRLLRGRPDSVHEHQRRAVSGHYALVHEFLTSSAGKRRLSCVRRDSLSHGVQGWCQAGKESGPLCLHPLSEGSEAS
jgi:hypothetical protein